MSHGVFQKPKSVSNKNNNYIKCSLNNLVQEDKSDPLFTPGPTHYVIKDISNRSPSWKISESKRKEINLNSYTKQCGEYRYKSFIGEGPKYTFSQKFNLDGTTDGKRHPKANAIVPTPGPGTYEIKSEFDGPKYSIGLKRIQKSLSQGDLSVPGVGSYQLRKDSSLKVPCHVFGKEKRENLNMNSSALNYPGPGKYSNENDKNSTVTPFWSFTKSERFRKLKPRNPKVSRLNVPGPGTYNFGDITGNEGPHFSFPKDKFNHSDSVDESMLNRIKNYPSPSTYNKSIDYIPDMPKYTISKMDRNQLNAIDSKFQTICPGPGKYDPNKDVSSTLKRITNCVIDKSKRYEEENDNPKIKKIITPGPGWYNIKNGLLPQGPKYTIRNVKKTTKMRDVPGPGKYNPLYNIRHKEPSYSIGKEQRCDDLKIVKKNNYPGPGKYNVVEMNLAPKYSFPKNDFRKNRKAEVPGPGFYKIPTSFDYISDMTRSQGTFNPIYRYV